MLIIIFLLDYFTFLWNAQEFLQVVPLTFLGCNVKQPICRKHLYYHESWIQEYIWELHSWEHFELKDTKGLKGNSTMGEFFGRKFMYSDNGKSTVNTIKVVMLIVLNFLLSFWVMTQVIQDYSNIIVWMIFFISLYSNRSFLKYWICWSLYNICFLRNALLKIQFF